MSDTGPHEVGSLEYEALHALLEEYSQRQQAFVGGVAGSRLARQMIKTVHGRQNGLLFGLKAEEIRRVATVVNDCL